MKSNPPKRRIKPQAQPRKGNFVGTSLRGCIRDIVDGNHPVERVEHIICPTEFQSLAEVLTYVMHRKTPDDEKIAEVVERLWKNRKIVRPQLDGQGNVPPNTIRLWIPVEEVRRPSATNLF